LVKTLIAEGLRGSGCVCVGTVNLDLAPRGGRYPNPRLVSVGGDIQVSVAIVRRSRNSAEGTDAGRVGGFELVCGVLEWISAKHCFRVGT